MNQVDSITKVKVNTKVVSCSGGETSSGHPTVYYHFGNKKKRISLKKIWNFQNKIWNLEILEI